VRLQERQQRFLAQCCDLLVAKWTKEHHYAVSQISARSSRLRERVENQWSHIRGHLGKVLAEAGAAGCC